MSVVLGSFLARRVWKVSSCLDGSLEACGCWKDILELIMILLHSNSIVVDDIGVGDGGRGQLPPPQKKKSGKYFSGIYHVKFGNFVNFSAKYHVKFGHFGNFSCIYFRAKMSCPPKLTELLRLWSTMSTWQSFLLDLIPQCSLHILYLLIFRVVTY